MRAISLEGLAKNEVKFLELEKDNNLIVVSIGRLKVNLNRVHELGVVLKILIQSDLEYVTECLEIKTLEGTLIDLNKVESIEWYSREYGQYLNLLKLGINKIKTIYNGN